MIERLDFSGHSMLPVFTNGDQLLVDFNSPKNIEVGDIVLVKDHEEWISHRVVKYHDCYYIKGDRSGNLERFNIDSVFGKIVGFHRGNHTVFWGSVGQPFKQVFAWLSVKNQLDLAIGNKWRRWTCLIIMLAFNHFILVWLKTKRIVKKPKPYGSFSS